MIIFMILSKSPIFELHHNFTQLLVYLKIATIIQMFYTANAINAPESIQCNIIQCNIILCNNSCIVY